VRFYIPIFLCFSCCFCFCEESLSVEALKEQIQAYESRAKEAERNADRLITIDYTSYRFYINRRDRAQSIADDLKKKLAEIDPDYQEKE